MTSRLRPSAQLSLLSYLETKKDYLNWHNPELISSQQQPSKCIQSVRQT